MASNIKVDIVRPTATNGTLALKGDSGGSGTSNGIWVEGITGDTGIGTATPTNPLHVYSASNDDVVLVESGDANTRIKLKDSASTNGTGIVCKTDDLVFETNGANERVRIDSSGNVGINTTPSYPLDVFSSTGDTIARIKSGDANARLILIDGNTVNGTGIVCKTDDLVFETNGTNEQLRIKSDGTTQLASDKNLTLQGSGKISLGTGGVAYSTTDIITISGGVPVISADVRFPAGHVVQTTQNTYNSADSATTTSATASLVSDGASNYYWGHTISGMTAGNDVLINFTFVSSVSRSPSGIAGGSWHIYRDSISNPIYTSTDDINEYFSLGSTPPVGVSIFYRSYKNLSFLDTGATGTSHSYYLGYSAWNGSDVTVLSASTRQPFVAILQEIQT